MIWVGTSGYSYPEWRGTFYPPDLPTEKMLSYYSARFPTVEINYTFYHMPSEKVLTAWAKETPEGFTFTLKASRRITHDARLRNCEGLLETLWTRASALGPKLGVLLFQLPPSFRKDLSVFDAFLALMPEEVRAAFEFRHPSWLSDDVFARLKAKNLALCIADSEKGTTSLEVTAEYGYFRLRDEGYQEADIERWSETITRLSSSWKDVFVYFKHEDAGKGPEFARMLMDKVVSQ